MTDDPKTTPDAGLIERVARALCVDDGFDPDEDVIGGQAAAFTNYGPRWQANEKAENQLGSRNYVREARVAISAIREA